MPARHAPKDSFEDSKAVRVAHRGLLFIMILLPRRVLMSGDLHPT